MDEGGQVEPPGRRAQTALFTLILAVLVIGTVAGVVLARDDAEDAVDDRARRTAEAVAAVVEVELEQVAARLAGAGAVVDADGRLDLDAFRAFAADGGEGERPAAMVFNAVVPRAERAAFEAWIGRPIAVRAGDGTRPAPDADVHHPAVAVEGAPPGRDVIGLDFGADPSRREAFARARVEGRPALSATLELSITGRRGVSMVRPVVGPDGSFAGFVSVGIPAEHLAELVQTAVAEGADVALLDGDEVLVGPSQLGDLHRRQQAAIDLADRQWVVAVAPGGDVDHTTTWIVAIAGLVATATTATLLVLTERHQRRLARTNALLARNEARGRAAQDVAGRLARALTGDEVASALVDQLPTAVEARTAVVALRERGRFQVLRPGAEPARLPDPAPGSLVEQVVATGTPAWLRSPLDWKGDEVAAQLAGSARALAVLPLRGDDVTGVLAVGYPQVHIFGPDEQALLQTVGVLAERALARGRRYDVEHQAALAFQRAALPDALPDVPGLEVAARYRPAVRGATVGGDWYDVLRLGDDGVLLVVGDVVGHGMTAAAAMGRLRTAFRTIVPYTGDPGSMLEGIDQQADTIPDAFCTTVVCAVVDVETGMLSWSRAGHPPPLVVRPGEGATMLDQPCLPPLGVAPGTDAPVHHHRLEAGDLLVLYTDGLVERRGEDLDEGFRRLAVVTEDLVDLQVDELADALVEAMVPADAQDDDLAVLVVRVGRSGPG